MKPSILIAMPTMGSIQTNSVKSLVALTQTFRNDGIAFSFATHEFSDIVISRNQLLSQFYQDQIFTHVLLLDSDISYHPATIMRMLNFGEDFVAAPYAQKYFYWDKIRNKIQENAKEIPEKRLPMSEILNETWLYNFQAVSFDRTKWKPEYRDGFITVPATGTGLMLLSRSVPEILVSNGQARLYPAHAQKPKHKGVPFYDFFSHLPSNDSSAFYGEDQSFCMRWSYYCQQKIWLDTEANIAHEGGFQFQSRLGDHDPFI